MDSNKDYQIKDIPRFPGYRIDTDGIVWSAHKQLSGPVAQATVGAVWGISNEWKQKATITDQKGYAYVTLSVNGESVNRFIHWLLLLTFVGPPMPGQMTRHIDGNNKNNSLKNLKWGTSKQNYWDARRHGTQYIPPCGENHPAAKFKRIDILAMYDMRLSGEKHKTIANKYGIAEAFVSQILSGKKWPDVHLEMMEKLTPSQISMLGRYGLRGITQTKQ